MTNRYWMILFLIACLVLAGCDSPANTSARQPAATSTPLPIAADQQLTEIKNGSNVEVIVNPTTEYPEKFTFGYDGNINDLKHFTCPLKIDGECRWDIDDAYPRVTNACSPSEIVGLARCNNLSSSPDPVVKAYSMNGNDNLYLVSPKGTRVTVTAAKAK